MREIGSSGHKRKRFVFYDTLEPYDTMEIRRGDIRLMKDKERQPHCRIKTEQEEVSMVVAVTQVVTEARENVRAGKLADDRL